MNRAHVIATLATVTVAVTLGTCVGTGPAPAKPIVQKGNQVTLSTSVPPTDASWVCSIRRYADGGSEQPWSNPLNIDSSGGAVSVTSWPLPDGKHRLSIRCKDIADMQDAETDITTVYTGPFAEILGALDNAGSSELIPIA